jgi:RNA recognition motif-containing protein
VAGKISLFQGTAEVVFALQTDALAAIKRYNNVQLDGKPLKIELVGDNVITPVPVLVTTTTNLAKPKKSLEGTTLLVIIQTWNQLLSCIHWVFSF